MLLPLNEIQRSCARSAAGITRIVIIEPTDLATEPDTYSGLSLDDLDFKPGKTAYYIHHAIHSARLTDETPTDNPAGDYFSYKLSAFLRNLRQEVETLRRGLLNHRVHVIVTLRDGTEKFLPYMRLSMASDTGAKLGADRPGYTLTGTMRKGGGFGGGVSLLGGDVEVPTPPLPDSPASEAAEVVKDAVSTNAASLTHQIPSGVLLLAVWLKSNADQDVSIGLTSGGDELGGPQSIPANTSWNFAQSLRTTEATDIFISGLAGSNSIEFWYAQLGEGDIVKVAINTSAAEYEFILPAGVLLQAVWLRGDTNQTITIGLASGGDELGGPQSMFANQGHTFAQTLRPDNPLSIFISGMAGSNQIEIWYAI